MEALRQRVFIVDDDEAIRDSLQVFLQSAGLEAKTFPDAESFLGTHSPQLAGCLLLDVRMPAMSGLGLQEDLVAIGSSLPIIFITGHGDVPTAVQALKAGAFDFIEKPFDHARLLELVRTAFEHDRVTREALSQQNEIRERIASLTPRETEVLGHMVNGKANKVIAIELELSQRTVEIYRANVMQKMRARSLAQLVKMVGEVEADGERS